MRSPNRESTSNNPAFINLWQKAQDTRLLDNFIQQLNIFRFKSPFLNDFHNIRNMLDIQKALFNGNLQRLPTILNTVMPAKFRRCFLNEILSLIDARLENPLSTSTRPFHVDFLQRLSGKDRETMLGHLTHTIQILDIAEQMQFGKRLLASRNLTEPYFATAKKLLAGLSEQLPLTRLVFKDPKPILPIVSLENTFASHPTPVAQAPYFQLTNDREKWRQQYTPHIQLQPVPSLLIPSTMLDPAQVVEKHHSNKRPFPFLEISPDNSGVKRQRSIPPPVTYVRQHRFFPDVQVSKNIIRDPIVSMTENDIEEWELLMSANL